MPSSRRTNRGSDTELVWASSVQEFKGSFQFVQPKKPPGRDRRDRRARGSSEDDEGEAKEGETNQDTAEKQATGEGIVESFIDEELRAGGPFLCPLPATFRSLSDQVSRYDDIFNDDGMREAVEAIIKEHGIQRKTWGVGLRRADWFPEDDPIVTLLIEATKTAVEDKWVELSKALRRFLIMRGFPDASVEIIDPRAMLPRFTHPLLRSDQLFPLWDQILSIILDSIDLTDITVISCWRYGVSSTTEENPPTIIVTVKRDSIRTWKPLREMIVSILDTHYLDDVSVNIEKGSVFQCISKADVRLPTSLWQQAKALPGVSLGNTLNTDSSGTFGGYIELQNKKGEWVRFGLTCYHVALAADKALDDKNKQVQGGWHIKGIEWENHSAKQILTLQQASYQDLHDEKEALQERIHEITNPEFLESRALAAKGELFPPFKKVYEHQEYNLHKEETTLTQMDTLEERLIGYTICASGFRRKLIPGSKDFMHLDWALLMMDKQRMGTNRVDAYGAPRFSLPDVTIGQPVQPEHGMPVYKMGRSTEWTMGIYNGLKAAYIDTINEKDETTQVSTHEAVVCGVKGREFADKGDSGSFVFTTNMRFVGMISAGNGKGNGYITLASHLFEDIMASTGAVAARLPLD
ncbi:hypothetical protein ASPZODRAFT_2114065 [Penicilliopsis zonata CBS 506.65]|uniref:Uncharacterized protein n=1 Tax=Penicilliopsis zonata CBS 506.65 TaxID=1073090 RepID=A0A1L9S8R9_9EURO|nr:hypothetical protein ASPZODRAFT_2114065 [Penicilliopsis zonata CBS 506.65]OJJ43556.1 hypothetical protein ASPZODRAFT_2114065 [Penicilliopsis zonata CBS 506.65]